MRKIIRKCFTFAAPVALVLGPTAMSAGPAAAAGVAFSGTRSNVTPIVGVPGGRCAPAITVGFSPDSLSASGTSNLGAFEFVGSHCIAGFPPGPYYDGVVEWQFADGTLNATYDGVLTVSTTPGVFDFTESILFTGGTGKFAGASGLATAIGTLGFGQVEGISVSIGNATFQGHLDAPAIPEPATWGMMILGFGAVGGMMRRRGRALGGVMA
jgi:hypothetical protein